MNQKRVIFLGEKPLGLKCLQLLNRLPEVDLIAVCTRLKGDFWWGRQEIIDCCEKRGIPLIPRSGILSFDVDLLISVLYPFIIEPEYIRHARSGCFNLHEAPLPRWRGCNNYSHAILAGDRFYGTTLHEMKPELDAGDIVAKRMFPIPPGATARELYELTTQESYRLAQEWFPRILCGKYRHYPPSPGEESFLNQRDSLVGLKEVSLDTPWSRAMVITAALDFVPWAPAYVMAHGDKYHLFLESSMGRDHATFPDIIDLDEVDTLAAIPWNRFEVGRVGKRGRAMVICIDERYRQQFPLRA